MYVATPLYAQHSGHAIFERFSTAQGLSNYGVTSILQDQQGFLWLGTQAGLNRYDGYTFVPYTTANSDLADDFIQALYEDHAGVIWIGTAKAGVYTFDPETEQFTGYAHDGGNPGSLSHNNVQAIYEDQSGTVWIGTLGGGLNRFDRATGQFTHYRGGENGSFLLSDSVRAMYEVASVPGILWIGTEGGLERLDVRTPSVSRAHSGLYDDRVHSIHDVVQTLYADQSGMLWIGTQSTGLYALQPGTGGINHYQHESGTPNSLASTYVLAIHEDSSGGLWIGTYDGGLNRLDRATRRFTRYENVAGEPGSLPNNRVQAIHVDHSGVLWVGTWGG